MTCYSLVIWKLLKKQKKTLKSIVKINKVETFNYYLGIKGVICKENSRAWLGLPTIIKSLKDKFKEFKEHETVTPGKPGFIGVRAIDDKAKTNEKD